MLFDDGILRLCELTSPEDNGNMPAPVLREVTRAWYGRRTVGYNRQYAAMGANQRVDLLLRTWYLPAAQIGMYVMLEGGLQYRLDNVQHLLDEDGLRVTDLTLQRLEAFYDVVE